MTEKTNNGLLRASENEDNDLSENDDNGLFRVAENEDRSPIGVSENEDLSMAEWQRARILVWKNGRELVS